MNNHNPQVPQPTEDKSGTPQQLHRKIFPAANAYSVLAALISLAGFLGLLQYNVLLFGLAVACSVIWLILAATTKLGKSFKVVPVFLAVDSIFTGIGVVALLPAMGDIPRALSILAIGLVYFVLSIKMFDEKQPNITQFD